MEYADDIMSGADTLRTKSAPTPDLDALVGILLDGRYRIERKLGQGGFGTVYLASDGKAVSRKVVVKVMSAEETTNEWSRKKFKQEFEALARIDHPSVVGVFDCGETPDGRPYIAMQYIDGLSLRSLLTPEGMPFWRVAKIIRQVGNALSAAHQAGILHRDLKPENIMVKARDDDESVKVIDFGVAKVKNSIIGVSTAKDMVVGTLAYMSPEQLSAQPLTPESDIYALGVIAYEMLTGRKPTNPESAFQLLELQRSGVRVKPMDLRPGLPQTAETIVLKALSFEPQDRYERARDFGDQLARALLGDDEQTEPEHRSQQTTLTSENLSLETAHVLFMDIIGYSRLLIDEQTQRLRQLQEIVLGTNECKRAYSAKELIRLPTGDGMALVFFQDPEAPVRCSVEISQALKANPGIELRMGVHSGFVYRMADVNTNMNVAGGGINLAQRVMDCGDQGHILLSKRVADDLGQLARWSAYLEDLGDAEVKHGVHVHLFNFHGNDFGNPERPTKLRKTLKQPLYKRSPPIVAASLIVVVLIAAGVWYALTTKTKTAVDNSPKSEVIGTVGPDRSLTYWLTIQKMLKNKPLGAPIQSAGDISFGNGWRFQFNLQPTQSGALYLLNVGPGKDGGEEYNILYPLPGAGRPNLVANQTVQSDWYRFVEQTGVEKVWLIWSTQPVPELDAIFSDAARNQKDPGVIANPDQIVRIKSYLKKYETSRPEITADKSRKLTSVKGQGDILVCLIELSHEAY